MPRYTRYTMDLDQNFNRVLNDLVLTTGSANKADVIRRAIASYKFLKDAEKDGDKVSITDRDDRVKKDVVLP